ncbi:MAG: nucleoside deaminase [Bdellovibrionales bacterium]|nr:nucleoside deaminase [Bdellovibrionales bacterium]
MSLMQIKNHNFFMKKALEQAKKAFKQKEVPVGAIIVKNNRIISQAFNLREKQNSPIGHAEILAIDQASQKLNSWRLENCSIYVSLEPCLMCLGAILQARISKLIYASSDIKTGFSSYYQLDKEKTVKNKLKITSSIYEDESSKLLKLFFKKLRQED